MKNASGSTNGAYTYDVQPKQQKQLAAFSTALFFAFNLFFFGPVEFYFSNLIDLLINVKAVMKVCVPISLAVFAVLLAVCLFTRGKAHIICISLFFGLGLAFYIQGNFLQIGAGLLDGKKENDDPLKIAVNLLIWLIIIALPWIIYFVNNVVYTKVITFGSLGVCLIETVTIISVFISTAYGSDWSLSKLILSDEDNIKCFSMADRFTYSRNKNFIILLADEYDSFVFDEAVSERPESVSGLGGCTYYRNTVGMFSFTSDAVPFILCGERNYSPGADMNDAFFSALKENGYKIDIYSTSEILADNISENYAENYCLKKFTYDSYIGLTKNLYKLVMYRYAPIALKNFFRLPSGNFSYEMSKSSNMQSYHPDNLEFYNSLTEELVLVDEPCFKYFYIDGIHAPRTVTADLERDASGSVTGTEEAIAVNLIASEYFNMLRRNGIYDNSEIFFLADHGARDGSGGKYPLLIVKRRGESSGEFTVSDAPVSHEDLFPSLIALAQDNGDEAPLFCIDEDAERERFFEAANEYITGNIKRSAGDLQ